MVSAMSNPCYYASVEVSQGMTYQHPYHLGTDLRMARHCCEAIYYNRIDSGKPVVSIGLMLSGKLIDTFDGVWFEEAIANWEPEADWSASHEA